MRVIYISPQKEPEQIRHTQNAVWIEWNDTLFIDCVKAACRMRPDFIVTDVLNNRAMDYCATVGIPCLLRHLPEGVM